MHTRLIALIALIATLVGCRDIDQYEASPYGTFDAVWNTIDRHYCFLQSKNIDWDSIGSQYRARLRPQMYSTELFAVIAEMLDELKDGHVNLSSGFDVSYYRKWWSDYPENYDPRLVEHYYLNYDWHQASGLTYGVLVDNIGYIRYDSFSSAIGEGNLDYVLDYLAGCDGLILDIRSNGGGDLTNVERLVSRFIDRRILAGYIIHKTGPGHDDFSEPYPYYIDPAGDGHTIWSKPVAVLVNRHTYSAANDFTSIMSRQSGVIIVGDRTGGGGAMPFNTRLPNGWALRFSTAPLLNPDMTDSESGVDPTPGCHVDLDPQAALNGIDTIIALATTRLLNP